MDEPVAVIIVNYRTPQLTIACLKALQQERPRFRKLEAVVVDGGSADNSVEELSAWIATREHGAWVRFLPLGVNGGFGWANNQAIQRLLKGSDQPGYVHLLNPDAEIEPGAVVALAEYLNSHPAVAAVGSQLLEPDGSSSGSAFHFPSLRSEFSRGARTGILDRMLRLPSINVETPSACEVDWTTGASVMLRVEALRHVGLFDEGIFLYHEEMELMRRLRNAGWAIAIEPLSLVRHIGGGSTGIHDRSTPGRLKPRKPRYWYRSRSRYFTLAHGPTVAVLAVVSWLLGHAFWRLRHFAGAAPRESLVGHEFRDQLLHGFPRVHDAVPAPASADGSPSARPAWMEKGWL